MSNATNYLQKIINEETNPMLVKNYLMKVEKAVKNIESWIADMNPETAEKIKSNVSTAIKNIELIKTQLQ
jgi:hypothetical protein